ncbi:MAG: type II toxin-antitoxin system RelE/ParE family toxin [Novosphingobium sp.]|uniref:type II toxin-antitoxin system RelE/ParE family toxin n=1 Tax=Novosphingobium sp. TaxID=1874826 RepID=UPI002735B51C|nr:type II toxin-antitoxin system RelE/ParE family toxin [Novosphingobium sp.]MDP3552252.1 type II toxin-antitoxin system RelE/ParE family toxin [Novosphingobium sp.]
MRRILWTTEAMKDRDGIFDRIEREAPHAAEKLDATFEEKCLPLARHPFMGRSGRLDGTRELVVHNNYRLLYDVTDEAVRILRLLHARRQWPDEG